MPGLRFLALAVALLAGAPSLAVAQSSEGVHWLIGSWTGERNVGIASRTGSERLLTVRKVAADGGSATGTWKTERGSVAVKITIQGDHVSFSSGTKTMEGSDYSLDRKGDALVGTFTGSGKPTVITLTKQK